MQKIKYGDKPELATSVGYWLGDEIKTVKTMIDLIVPIPLHKKKQISRGYNQSDYFAKGLSEATDIKWSSKIVYRVKNNPSQTNKSRIDRIDNVEGIFQVQKPDEIRSKNILLVDDVITTGATLYACSKALSEAGAQIKGIGAIALAK